MENMDNAGETRRRKGGKGTLIALVLILAAAAVLLFRCDTDGYIYADGRRYTAGEATVTGRVSELDVNWISGKVTVATHDGEGIILAEKAERDLKEKEQLHWWLNDDKLYIKHAASSLRSLESVSKELTILLPRNLQLDKLVIATVSADVEGTALAAEEMKLETVSGRANLEVLRSKAVDMDTVSGDMRIRCEAVPEKIDFSGVSGGLVVALPEGAGFTAKLDSVSGDVTSTVPATREGDKYTVGDGACEIGADTVSGDLRLESWEK